MKLSLSNCSSNQYLKYGETQRTTLQALRDCGFSCTDFDIIDPLLEGDVQKNAEEVAQMLSELGLTAPTAHAPCRLNPLKYPEQVFDIMCKTLRFCQYASIPKVVIHPGALIENTRDAFFERNIDFYRSLLPIAEETGVTVLTENIGNYADPYFLWNGNDLRELVDRVDHPLFAACWDIGHANHFFKEDCEQYSSILALGDKLHAIHAHDNVGYISDTYKHHRLDMHTFPYFSSSASVNWDAVLQGLKDIGYAGTFNFETNAPARSDREPFVCNGKVIETLRIMPLGVWKSFNTALYQMGAEMLRAYGLYEE